jgi:hypothetical protein
MPDDLPAREPPHKGNGQTAGRRRFAWRDSNVLFGGETSAFETTTGGWRATSKFPRRAGEEQSVKITDWLCHPDTITPSGELVR